MLRYFEQKFCITYCLIEMGKQWPGEVNGVVWNNPKSNGQRQGTSSTRSGSTRHWIWMKCYTTGVLKTSYSFNYNYHYLKHWYIKHAILFSVTIHKIFLRTSSFQKGKQPNTCSHKWCAKQTVLRWVARNTALTKKQVFLYRFLIRINNTEWMIKTATMVLPITISHKLFPKA